MNRRSQLPTALGIPSDSHFTATLQPHKKKTIRFVLKPEDLTCWSTEKRGWNSGFSDSVSAFVVDDVDTVRLLCAE